MDRGDNSQSSNSGNLQKGTDDQKIYRDFDRFGLTTTTSADAIDFIQSSLSETKKKKDHLQVLQEAVTLKKEDFLGPAADSWPSDRNSYAQAKRESAGTKASEPRWNTGTVDFNSKYKFQKDRRDAMMTAALEEPERLVQERQERSQQASFHGQMEALQQRGRRVLGDRQRVMDEYQGHKQQTKGQEIGELARYERDSEKSEDEKQEDPRELPKDNGLYSKVNSKLRAAVQAQLLRGTAPQMAQGTEGTLPADRLDSIVKARLLDSETARHDQKVKAMRAKQDRELEEMDQIFCDTESGRSGSDHAGRVAPYYGPGSTHGKKDQTRGDATRQFEDDPGRLLEREKALYSKSKELTGASPLSSAKDTQTAAKARIETDMSKWEGTGLEEVVKSSQQASGDGGRAYQNPVEKKKSKKKDKRAAKKKNGQSTGTQPEESTQIIIAGEPVAAATEKDSTQKSLFSKSSPINLNDLPQKQTQRIYNLGGPVLINQNWEFYSGHPQAGSAGEVDDMTRTQRSRAATANAMKHNADYQRMTKNQIVTASKFYTLKENQSLPCHFNQNKDRANNNSAAVSTTPKDLPRVYNQGAYSGYGGNDIADATLHGPGRRTLASGAVGRGNQGKGAGRAATSNETSIPSVKEWFQQLTLAERILCVTTVDPNITTSINNMYKQLKTVHRDGDRGKFRLKTSTQTFNMQVTDLTQRQKGAGGDGEVHGGCSWSMLMCNQNAYPSSAEVKAAESQLLAYIRITDTVQMHDTLTVKEELMKDPEAFYSLAERIVGSNFLRGRHDVEWHQEKAAFESKAPLWLEMGQPNSLAAWLLYYLERAMCIQYDCNIYGRFLSCKDKKKESAFLAADKQLIRDEMKPSWRNFCADAAKEPDGQQVQQFLQMLRTQALQKFGVTVQEKDDKAAPDQSSKVNHFHGGLSLHNESVAEREAERDMACSEQRHVVLLIEDFVERVKGFILNHTSEDEHTSRHRLDLSEICMDQLEHSSAVENPNSSHADVASAFNFQRQIQRAPLTTMALARAGGSLASDHEDSMQMNDMRVANIHMEMKLERLMTETFKEFRNQRLLQGFQSQNKKSLRKKLKKKLQKEQEEERERQRQEEQKRIEEEKARKRKLKESMSEEEGHIKINNSAAVQLLLGQDNLAHPALGKSKQMPEVKRTPVTDSLLATQSGTKQSMGKAGRSRGTDVPPQQLGPESQLAEKQVDPFNYFQVLAQKQSVQAQAPNAPEAANSRSEESQGRANRQRRPAQPPVAAAPGGSSHCGTTRTISTCDESKQVEQRVLAVGAQVALQDQQLDSVMSNQDFLVQQRQFQGRDVQASGGLTANQNGDKHQYVPPHHKEGNALFKTKHWQRKDNTKAVKELDEIIGELMSESSSTHGRSRAHVRNTNKYQVIDLAIKGNKMHAHKSHVATDQDDSEESAGQSSMSSRKETNQIITFKKPHVRRVVPKPRPRSSSSSNGESGQSATDSDQDLLPDVYAKFDPQPHDNDSSDYGAEEPHEEVDILNMVEDEEPDAESLVDNSSMAYEKSIGDPSLLTASAFKKQYAKISDKKSIQTAYPKIEGQLVRLDQQGAQGSKRKGARKKTKKNKIDFYEHDKAGESCEEDDGQIPQPKITKQKAMKMPTIPALTMQLIELESQEWTSTGEVKQNLQPTGKNKNKKNKKQRRLEYLNRHEATRDQEQVQAKQIEIIKPVKEPQLPSKKGKAAEQAKEKQGQDGAAQNEKKKKKKAPEQVDAMNSFISRLQGRSSSREEMNRTVTGAVREGAEAIQKKGKRDPNLQKQEANTKSMEKSKKANQGAVAAPSKISPAAGNVESSDQTQTPVRTPAKLPTAKNQDGEPTKDNRLQEELNKQRPQAQSKQNDSQKRKEVNTNTKVSDPDKKGEKSSSAIPNEQKMQKTEQTPQQQNRDGKKQEEAKRTSQEQIDKVKESTASFNMNSQEFRLQKKQSTAQASTVQQVKGKIEEPETAQSPRKKFKSLQEALEYNQSTAQATTLSAKAAKGKRSTKNQGNKNSSKDQQIHDSIDLLNPSQSMASGFSGMGTKDKTSDKSQSSQPKKKKKRKNKEKIEASMNLQLQQSWIDPTTGATVYMDTPGGIGPLASGYGGVPGSGLAPGQMPGPFGVGGLEGQPMVHDGFMDQQSTALQLQLQKMTLQMQQNAGSQAFSPFNTAGQQPGLLMGGPAGQSMMRPPQLGGIGAPNIGHQVQELLFKIQEQYMAEQQFQMAEIQRRQQEEEEMQMMDDCDPCPEIDDVRYDQFFEELGDEMRAKVKEIDMLKDSVRKERQGFISIVEAIVKETFSNRYGNGYVGIKMFGSMATELAIETSDVDLVVTGINAVQQHGSGSSGKEPLNPKEHVLKIMQKLYDNLVGLRSTGQIQKIKFIQGATVPIIKLVADLKVINQCQTEKAVAMAKKEWEEKQGKTSGGKSGRPKGDAPKWEDVSLRDLGIETQEIDPRMRYLQVDISIDEQSDQLDTTRQFTQQMGTGGNPSASPGMHGDPQLTSGLALPPGMPPSRAHSGIDTIYHIQELARARKDLRPIVMIIKKIFDETFLSMPYCGGLSSFSLVLMVSAYLKRFDEKNTESLSRNLSGFFHFYGCGFKPRLHYLNGDNIEYEETKRPFPDPFIVLDPLDHSNNVGHSTFRIKDIQRALVQAFKIINKSCEEYQLLDHAAETRGHSDAELANARCLPKNVLERLLTEIRELHYQQNVWTDDDP